MNDVLTVALGRQRALRRELAEIDEFISMAENLMRNAKQEVELRPESRPESRPLESQLSGRPARPERAAQPETLLRPDAERPQIVDFPDASPEPVVRRFPWSNAQPPVRKTGSDEDARPTRRNLMRREAS